MLATWHNFLVYQALEVRSPWRFIWPAHFAGIKREYCQIEKLANLDQLPRPYGFYVSCLPVKIQGASAGWCRAVALVAKE